jgi:hypothetical protein
VLSLVNKPTREREVFGDGRRNDAEGQTGKRECSEVFLEVAAERVSNRLSEFHATCDEGGTHFAIFIDPNEKTHIRDEAVIIESNGHSFDIQEWKPAAESLEFLVGKPGGIRRA